MSKFDEAMDKYRSSMSGTLGMSAVDDDLLTKVAKGLGPSIYLGDASLVSCGDQTEKDRVKNNFLIGKLGCADGADLDAAIDAVCDQMGSSNRSKHRAVFYYLLVKQLGLESKYA
jgi:hypothetical protein